MYYDYYRHQFLHTVLILHLHLLSRGGGSSDNSIVDVEPTPTDETDGEQNGNENEIVGKEEGFDDETIADIDEVVDNENDVPATTEPVEDEEYQLENEIEPLADDVSVCNFVVSDGELGTDYQCNGVVLEIKTSTPLTIKTAGHDNTNYSTSINGGIRVLSGVSADLTLDGVNIVATAIYGIQLLAGSKLHLTLADGSINFLNTTQTSLSGINAPEGTELTIDDSIINKDICGSVRVPGAGKFQSSDNKAYGDAAKTQEVFKSKVYKDDEEGFRYYNYLDLSGQATFEEYISKVKDNSLYDTGVSAKYSDQILTLSTCSYYEKDGRFVFVAKK